MSRRIVNDERSPWATFTPGSVIDLENDLVSDLVSDPERVSRVDPPCRRPAW